LNFAKGPKKKKRSLRQKRNVVPGEKRRKGALSIRRGKGTPGSGLAGKKSDLHYTPPQRGRATRGSVSFQSLDNEKEKARRRNATSTCSPKRDPIARPGIGRGEAVITGWERKGREPALSNFRMFVFHERRRSRKGEMPPADKKERRGREKRRCCHWSCSTHLRRKRGWQQVLQAHLRGKKRLRVTERSNPLPLSP